MDLWRKKIVNNAMSSEPRLLKCLSLFDLILMGIGAIIGAGIFVVTGLVAATETGPAIVFSYIIAGIACGFSALAYAELASSVGGCGSAYGYAYAGFGELIAWVVGWALILEYAMAVSTVSVGWSGYFNDLLRALNIDLPSYLVRGYFSPEGGFNLLAFFIIMLLTLLLIIGIKASSRVNNVIVLIKLAVIFLFVVVASANIEPANWIPFSPFGWSGVIKGASMIFFAYIGFDAVSTAAEEAINPQRDLPRGIIGSLIICTILYIIVSGLLTGIANYRSLNVSSPISHVMLMLGYKTVASLIGVGAIAGLSTVMLVLFYGLTRVFFALSRDGLLPQFFAKTYERTQTPVRIILLCGFIMGLTAGFAPLANLAELVNIGTLFAFISVCIGVPILRYQYPDLTRPFKTPFMPFVPILGAASCAFLMINLPWVTIFCFLTWMSIGLVIYFFYSHKHSVLANQSLP